MDTSREDLGPDVQRALQEAAVRLRTGPLSDSDFLALPAAQVVLALAESRLRHFQRRTELALPQLRESTDAQRQRRLDVATRAATAALLLTVHTLRGADPDEIDQLTGEDHAGAVAEHMVATGASRIQTLAATVGGVPITWQTVGDDRVRPTHEELDGAAPDKEGFFHPGGESCRRPRDSTLSAAEAAGCRCWLVLGDAG